MSLQKSNNTKPIITALLAGIIFGFGLILAGMANPAKVLAFLNIVGFWDPSLALVKAAAIVVGLPVFWIAKRRSLSFLGLPFNISSLKTIDKRLVIGSFIFGIGWGLAGICPGPAIVLLGAGDVKGFVFVIAMLAGFVIFEIIETHLALNKTKSTIKNVC